MWGVDFQIQMKGCTTRTKQYYIIWKILLFNKNTIFIVINNFLYNIGLPPLYKILHKNLQSTKFRYLDNIHLQTICNIIYRSTVT